MNGFDLWRQWIDANPGSELVPMGRAYLIDVVYGAKEPRTRDAFERSMARLYRARNYHIPNDVVQAFVRHQIPGGYIDDGNTTERPAPDRARTTGNPGRAYPVPGGHYRRAGG